MQFCILNAIGWRSQLIVTPSTYLMVLVFIVQAMARVVPLALAVDRCSKCRRPLPLTSTRHTPTTAPTLVAALTPRLRTTGHLSITGGASSLMMRARVPPVVAVQVVAASETTDAMV